MGNPQNYGYDFQDMPTFIDSQGTLRYSQLNKFIKKKIGDVNGTFWLQMKVMA